MVFPAFGLIDFKLSLPFAGFGKIDFQIYPFTALHWLLAYVEEVILRFLAAASLLGLWLASGPAELLLCRGVLRHVQILFCLDIVAIDL
jgi:hypothetical protein